jgi:hypothetical protein
MQAPDTQEDPDGQVLLQKPQFDTSVIRSVHIPLHREFPAGHGMLAGEIIAGSLEILVAGTLMATSGGRVRGGVKE